MKKSSIAILLLAFALGALGAGLARAEEPRLQDNVPERYTVQKGDTLWGIAERFLKNPWRWPDLWRLNREQIRNPHRIYPGDVIVLDRSGATPQLTVERSLETIKLSPQARATQLDRGAIPSIPPADIEPYLTKPLVIDGPDMPQAPLIVAAPENPVVIGTGQRAYVTGVPAGAPATWQVYRPGAPLRREGEKAPLGWEAVHLGDARLVQQGEVSIIEIVKANQEIIVGDRLVPAPSDAVVNYVPHAPEHAVAARIIGLPTGVAEVGRGSVVALDRGSADGVEIGHVLAVYRPGGTVALPDTPDPWTYFPRTRAVPLPEERLGLVFVFRVFRNVSYALVIRSSRQVQLFDDLRNP